MIAPPRVVPRLAGVVVVCVLLFCLYGASPGKALRLHCPAPSAGAPAVAHCQLERGRRLGWLPAQHTTLDWTDFTLASRLCDNIPQGGVRFCHRLTLVGAQQHLTLSEWQTPLTPDAVVQGLRSFLSGQGQEAFDWQTPRPFSETLQTLALGLLLAITTWGLGPARQHRQPMDDDAG
ncbi:hypothetical protein GFS31_11620 [Leptolyngbya sp. BL0902]|uniref:hypothetical protein n=1 Tax=Leptolyngbya sp. BL0902 TaxID=1115757 RepID=UPI0018E797A9|nr:hypothetical protein [Leptolyngbya sp. BL0902]QQE64481.1 hypothetical protein GFS31_11620 [Leptolyngbya sp. BL0902]